MIATSIAVVKTVKWLFRYMIKVLSVESSGYGVAGYSFMACRLMNQCFYRGGERQQAPVAADRAVEFDTYG